MPVYNFPIDEHGEAPLRRLPSGTPLELHWEGCMDALQPLIYSGQLRQTVLAMPILNPSRYLTSSEREWQRAFVVISMLTQGYVWGNRKEAPETVLPNSLAIPLRLLADKIGCHPIINYAATVQYNWHKINHHLPLSIYNIGCNSLLTGSIDEAWFYLISVAIEAKSSVILPMIHQLHDALHQQPHPSYLYLVDLLAPLPSLIREMQEILNKMREECLPWVFYHRVRIYMSGWQHNSSFPKEGLTYGSNLESSLKARLVQEQGFDADWIQSYEPAVLSFAGASAAQSPLIQCIDALLGVSHESKEATSESYLMQMRQYMPKQHRETIEWIESWPVKLHSTLCSELSSIKDASGANQLKALRNDCLAALEAFRSDHIKIVTTYVVQQMGLAKKTLMEADTNGYQELTPRHNGDMDEVDDKKEKEKEKEKTKASLAALHRLTLSDRNDADNAIVRGTGGTSLVPFLKSIRDDVRASYLP